MLGLDIIGADASLGVSWGDVGDAGKWGFVNVVHPLGKGVATAFGAGAAAQSLENVEQRQGWLPATPSPTAAAVTDAISKGMPKATTKDAPKTPGAPSAVPVASGKPSGLGHAVAIAGAVGVFGIVALILRRLWQG